MHYYADTTENTTKNTTKNTTDGFREILAYVESHVRDAVRDDGAPPCTQLEEQGVHVERVHKHPGRLEAVLAHLDGART